MCIHFYLHHDNVVLMTYPMIEATTIPNIALDFELFSTKNESKRWLVGLVRLV